jgi:hypothetical protein
MILFFHGVMWPRFDQLDFHNSVWGVIKICARFPLSIINIRYNEICLIPDRCLVSVLPDRCVVSGLPDRCVSCFLYRTDVLYMHVSYRIDAVCDLYPIDVVTYVVYVQYRTYAWYVSYHQIDAVYCPRADKCCICPISDRCMVYCISYHRWCVMP